MEHDQGTSIGALDRGLDAAVRSATSLDAIEHWLQSQPGITHVELRPGVIKTYPVRREFVVTGGDDSAMSATYIVTVSESPTAGYQLIGIRADETAREG